ncbi:hypothetical protein HDU85_007617 [Gaertneriomyces sp. JEL0708]|nr:hypothetical protein HDU85_007617 [Gaertneriomyces sp. JEL0708]
MSTPSETPGYKATGYPPNSDPQTAAAKSGDATVQQNLDTKTPLVQQLNELYQLVDGLHICMMTTRRSDGELVSRPMAVRKRKGTDMWFLTNKESHKLDELQNDPHINLAFYKDGTAEWASISGRAKLVHDEATIQSLWGKDMHAWFGDLGDGIHTGGPQDPRLECVHVECVSAHYYKKSRTSFGVALQLGKSMMTGQTPDLGKVRHLEGAAVQLSREV